MSLSRRTLIKQISIPSFHLPWTAIVMWATGQREQEIQALCLSMLFRDKGV
jgi:hypothetical protein